MSVTRILYSSRGLLKKRINHTVSSTIIISKRTVSRQRAFLSGRPVLERKISCKKIVKGLKVATKLKSVGPKVEICFYKGERQRKSKDFRRISSNASSPSFIL